MKKGLNLWNIDNCLMAVRISLGIGNFRDRDCTEVCPQHLKIRDLLEDVAKELIIRKEEN